MTLTRARFAAAAFGLTLAGSLGAGPATQPARAAAAPAPMREAVRLIVPPRTEDMPNGSVFVTPRAQWIPKPFNGGTFYLIPCDKSEGTMSTAIVSPRPAAAEATRATAKVDWGKVDWGLLTRPTTQPSATVTP